MVNVLNQINVVNVKMNITQNVVLLVQQHVIINQVHAHYNASQVVFVNLVIFVLTTVLTVVVLNKDNVKNKKKIVFLFFLLLNKYFCYALSNNKKRYYKKQNSKCYIFHRHLIKLRDFSIT